MAEARSTATIVATSAASWLVGASAIYSVLKLFRSPQATDAAATATGKGGGGGRFSNAWIFSFVGLIHAVTCCSFAVYSLLATRPNDWLTSIFDPPAGASAAPLTRTEYALVVNSLGFFIADMALAVSWNVTPQNAIPHHIVSCWGLIMVIVYDSCGHQLSWMILLLEITNPCLNIHLMQKEEQLTSAADDAAHTHQRSTCFRANEIVYYLSFWVCRLILLPVLVYNIIRADAPVGLKIAAGLLQFMSLSIGIILCVVTGQRCRARKSATAVDAKKEQ